MGMMTIVMVSIALSLDALAVSLSCGLKIHRFAALKFFKIAASFGLFQGFMPLLGWTMGTWVKDYIGTFSNIVAAVVFAGLGVKTLRDALLHSKKTTQICTCECNNPYCLLGLAIATSIDALLIGMVFSLLNVDLLIAVPTIALITLTLSFCGLWLGVRAGNLIGGKAGIAAGVILLLLSVKSLF